MARIALGTAFRDSTPYLLDYFAQVTALRDTITARGDQLIPAWVWGDCCDATSQWLETYLDNLGCEAYLLEHTHGGKDYGHTQHPLRFQELAGVGNAVLSQVPPDVNVLLYVESDLLWRDADLLTLVDDLLQSDIALALPMVLRSDTSIFYDIWAYRIQERKFSPRWPYHPVLCESEPRFVELSGGGSAIAMTGETARLTQAIGFEAWDLWPGLLRALRVYGKRAWLDREVTIYHP